MSGAPGKGQRPREAILKEMMALLVLFIAGVFLMVKAWEIPAGREAESLSPGFWPKMCIFGILLGALVKVFEIGYKGRRRRNGSKEKALIEPPESTSIRVHVGKAAFIAVLCILAVLMMEFLGFALANFLFLMAFLSLTGTGSKVKAALISLIGTISILYFFVKIVYIPFPKGFWIFEGMTIALYRLLHIF